jgi:hypothetical protein
VESALPYRNKKMKSGGRKVTKKSRESLPARKKSMRAAGAAVVDAVASAARKKITPKARADEAETWRQNPKPRSLKKRPRKPSRKMTPTTWKI